MTAHAHDRLFRHIFAQPACAAGLLHLGLPPALARRLPIDQLAVVRDVHVDTRLAESRADLLLRMPLGRPQRELYFLVEHRSRSTASILLDLVRWILATWQGNAVRARAHHLPDVLPVVVYNGSDRWKAPRRLRHQQSTPAALAAYLRRSCLDLGYVLIDLARVSEQRIVQRTAQGPAAATAALLAMKHFHDRDFWTRLPRWNALLERVLDEGGSRDLRTLLLYVLQRPHPLPERQLQRLARALGARVAEVFMSTAERLRREGRREGRQEGLLEGQQKSLVRVLELRFGPLPERAMDQVRGAGTQQLETWLERAVTARSLDDVFCA